MFKLGRLQVITFFYTLALLLFTVYWSFYYHSFGSKKGDELFTTITIMLLITYFYFVVLQIVIEQTNWALALFLPVLNTIISFLITVVILWLGGFDGAPKEVILIFGVVFTLLSGMEGLVLWGKTE